MAPEKKDSAASSTSTKMEEDFTHETEVALQEADKLAEQGSLADAVERLLSVEKHTRLATDVKNTSELVARIIQLCGRAQDWKALMQAIQVISKRRAQLKQAVTRMVQEAMQFVDKIPDRATKIELISTLRSVSEGKIYVEVERARLTRTLAAMYESEGNIAGAADILHEVQVETIGSMERREKVDLLLEQVRLCLDKGDFVRAMIIANKVTAKSLADTELQDLKLRYHQLMIRYHTHFENYMDIFKSYQAIYQTTSVQQNRAQWTEALEHMVLFLVLSPFDNAQSDFMHRTFAEKKLSELSNMRDLLKLFIDYELIFWPDFEGHFRALLSQHPVFSAPETSTKRWDDLHKRIVEHNIRIVARYYSRITLTRLSQLLHLDAAHTERFVSDMVTSKTIYAKIDRIDGIISFSKPKQTADVLNEWSSNITQLLTLVEKTCHLINKENMVHASQHQIKSL